MTTNEWISLLTSVGALSAAIIALFTLFELFRQRKSSYQPDLCVVQNRFQLRSSDFGGLGLALDWLKSEKEGSMLSFGAYVSVVNIGFGAAKNISAQWSFDSDKFLKKVNDLAQKTHQPFYIETIDSMLLIRNQGKDSYMVNAMMNTTEFEYLLPLSQDDSGKTIVIPPSYTMLVSIYLSLVPEDDFKFNLLDEFQLDLELDYTDIGKGSKKTKHKIACNITSKSVQEGGAKPEFGVHLVEIS